MTGARRWGFGAAIVFAAGWAMAAGFRVPDREERRRAAGPTGGLPDALEAALDDAAFEPIPAPGPDDWLASHPETPRTFEDFVRSRPHRPDAVRRTIYLQPLGGFPDGAPPPDALRRFAEAWFSLPAKLLPAVDLASAGARRREARGFGPQYATGDLLRFLRGRLPPDAFCLLGVTMADLYPDPAWNFVFGQASLTERVGVYSLARYDPRTSGRGRDSGKTMLLRSLKVLAHETGHMFGIAHCTYYRCVMNGSNHLAEADARPLRLCPVDLRKLAWSAGFDVVERYRRLLAFERGAGLSGEARWTGSEIARISR